MGRWKKIWIKFLLVFLFITTNACLQVEHNRDTSTITAATDLSPSAPPDIDTIPITGDVTATPNFSPIIKSVDFPKSIIWGKEGRIGTVQFSDEDGDIYAAQFTCIECGCMDFEYFAFDPISSLSSGDIYAGTFQFIQSCEKCPASSDYEIVMQVQLYDHAEHASQPIEYTFICSE